MVRNGIVVLGPPPGEREESIRIIIPPKPGEEEMYATNEAVVKTMDVCSLSMANIGQETNLPSSKLPFTLKLFEMLEHVAETGQEDIVSWVENGQGFKVHDLDKFVEEIIPIYFKQSKYKSFQRQLYFYGFARSSKGPLAGSYSHPNFRRDRKALCLSMAPKKGCGRSADLERSKKVSQGTSCSLLPVCTVECPNDDEASVCYPSTPEDTSRCVSAYDAGSDAYVPDEYDWKVKMTDVILRTAAPAPTPVSTDAPPMVPRVSVSHDHHREYYRTNLLEASGYNGNGPYDACFQRPTTEQHYRPNGQVGQHVPFLAHEGDTCCVFDDMTFHYVEHTV